MKMIKETCVRIVNYVNSTNGVANVVEAWVIKTVTRIVNLERSLQFMKVIQIKSLTMVILRE